MGFEITSGPTHIMTLVGNVLTVLSTNTLDIGVHAFTIKVYIKEAPSVLWSIPMTVEIIAPVNIDPSTYKVFTPIAADVRYVVGFHEVMPLEFSFTFLNPCKELFQFFWFTVTDLATGTDISTS